MQGCGLYWLEACAMSLGTLCFWSMISTVSASSISWREGTPEAVNRTTPASPALHTRTRTQTRHSSDGVVGELLVDQVDDC